MPRNSSGIYALPAGNPVVPDTIIETDWANPTLADIAQALTDSLDRNGRGNMLAPFKFADGTVSAPAISFASEPSSGIYRPASKAIGVSILGSEVARFTDAAVTLNGDTTIDGDLTVTGSLNFSGAFGGKFGDGTEALPSITFESDTDTGIYRPVSNALGFTLDGAERMRLDIFQLTLKRPLFVESPDLNVILNRTDRTIDANITGQVAGTNRWQLVLGANTGVEGSGNTNSPFRLYRFTNGGSRENVPVIEAFRDTGHVVIPNLYLDTAKAWGFTQDATQFAFVHSASDWWTFDKATRSLTWMADVPLVLRLEKEGHVTIPRLWLDTAHTWGMNEDATLRYFQYSATHYWRYNKATGDMSWVAASAGVDLLNDGSVKAQQFLVRTADSQFRLYDNGAGYRRLAFADQYRLDWSTAGGDFSWIHQNRTHTTFSEDNSIYLWAGQGFKPGGGPWGDVSDARIKSDVANYTRGLAHVMQLQPRSFRYIPETGRDTTRTHIGLIAQEAQAVMPEMVGTVASASLQVGGFNVPHAELLTLDTTALAFALVNAVKELKELTDSLDFRVTNIEGVIN